MHKGFIITFEVHIFFSYKTTVYILKAFLKVAFISGALKAQYPISFLLQIEHFLLIEEVFYVPHIVFESNR